MTAIGVRVELKALKTSREFQTLDFFSFKFEVIGGSLFDVQERQKKEGAPYSVV